MSRLLLDTHALLWFVSNDSALSTSARSLIEDADEVLSMEIAMLGTQAGHGLLAIDPQVYPYRVFVPEHCVPLGEEFVTQIRICADAVGNVSGMRILRSSLPIIDSQLPGVIARWRYNPYIVDGRATPFCYPMNYMVR